MLRRPTGILVDVLQRISDHPASDVESLTPRMWKKTYADTPLCLDLSVRVNDSME